jgi:hypothetical protein
MSNHDIKLVLDEDRGYYISEEDSILLRKTISDYKSCLDKIRYLHNLEIQKIEFEQGVKSANHKQEIESLNKDARDQKINAFLAGVLVASTLQAGVFLIVRYFFL